MKCWSLLQLQYKPKMQFTRNFMRFLCSCPNSGPMNEILMCMADGLAKRVIDTGPNLVILAIFMETPIIPGNE